MPRGHITHQQRVGTLGVNNMNTLSQEQIDSILKEWDDGISLFDISANHFIEAEQVQAIIEAHTGALS